MSHPFEIGRIYKTLDGRDVRIVADQSEFEDRCPAGYERVRGDDNLWRHNTNTSGRGRCIGSTMTDPDNLIPEPDGVILADDYAIVEVW